MRINYLAKWKSNKPTPGFIDKMIKSAITSILFLMLILNSFAQVNLTSGLKAYYPFNGNANDASGNNNNGQLLNGTTFTTDINGIPNSAALFDGINDFIQILDNGGILNRSAMSFSMQIKPFSSTVQTLIAKQNFNLASETSFQVAMNFAPYLGAYWWVQKSNNAFCGSTSSPSSVTVVNTGVNLVANNWYCLSGTYQNDTIKIFLNGTLIQQKYNGTGLIDSCTNHPIRLGRWNEFGPTPYNGIMDEVRIYNRALNQQEISALAICSNPCPINFATNMSKCSNQNINLTARAGTTYSWTPATGLSAANIQSPVCSATTNTTYIATIVNTVTNCTYKDTINVTVNTPATVTTQPTAITVCSGDTAKFIGAGSGTGATYQWLSGPTAAGPFTNVTTGTGANTNTYTTPVTTPAMNGTYYTLLVSTTTCPATVTAAAVLLTVNTVASISAQPISQNVCTPQPATFSVAATGTGLSYQWQVSTPANPTFTNIAGATNAVYTTGATTFAMNGNKYRVNILSTCSPTVPLVSNAATLTINNPAIAQQPQLQTGCAGDSYTFSVTTTATPATLTYQWQSSANGLPGTFINIAGANASSYTITNAPILLNGYYFRVYITTPCGSGTATDTSAAARLLLSNRISIVLTAPYTSNYNPAVNSGIFTTVSPVGNYNYTWKRNGIIIPNTRTATFILLAVDDEASYEVSITDSTTNCISRSNIIKTTAKTSDNLLLNQLFIYPNPASSIVLIRYNNSNHSARNTMLNIYDSKGARVYTNAYPIVGTFGNMEVNISKLPPNTYMVYLMDSNGKKLAGGKLVKIK